jgi:hypothetical protein
MSSVCNGLSLLNDYSSGTPLSVTIFFHVNGFGTFVIGVLWHVPLDMFANWAG